MVRNKDINEPNPSSQAFHFPPSLWFFWLFPFPCRKMGEWGLWLVYGPQPLSLCQSFLLKLFHWSNVVLLRWLQHGPFSEAEGQCGPSTGCSSRRPCLPTPIRVSPWLHSGHLPSCSGMVLHGLQGNTCSTITPPTGCREIPAMPLCTSSPFFSDQDARKVVSHTFFPSLLWSVFPFPKCIFIEAPPVPSWGAQLWVQRARGVSWSYVYHRAAPVLFPYPLLLAAPPLSTPRYPHPAHLFTDKHVISRYHIRLLNSSLYQSKNLMYNNYYLLGKTIN